MVRKQQITEEQLKTIFANWKDLQPKDLEKIYTILVAGTLRNKIKYFLFKLIIDNTVIVPNIINIELLISNGFLNFLKNKLTKRDEIIFIEFIKNSYKSWFNTLPELFALNKPNISSICENLLLEISVEGYKSPQYLGYFSYKGFSLIENILDRYKNADKRRAFFAAFEIYKFSSGKTRYGMNIEQEFQKFIKKYPEFEKYATLI